MTRPLPYRNQSTDLQSKSVDWFLYYNDLRHERVNEVLFILKDAVHFKVYQKASIILMIDSKFCI